MNPIGLDFGLLCSFLLLGSHLTSGIRPKPKTVCPNFFISLGGHCYYFSDYVVQSRDRAFKQCQAMDKRAILVNIESIREWQTIKTFLKENELNNLYWWTGGSDRLKYGDWIWMGTNEPLYYTSWCRYEPSSDSTKHCLYLSPDWESENLCWRALSCNNKLYQTYFICEVEPLK